MKSRIKYIGAVIIIMGALVSMEANAQVIVKIKPIQPKKIVVKPRKPFATAVWVEGHWVWNKRQNKYQWRSGYWVKPKRNKVYVVGRWTKRSNGWVYVPGKWVSKRRA